MPTTPRRLALAVSVIALPLMLGGCLPGDGHNSAANPAGFLWGVWHGWVAPVSLIWGFFVEPGIRVYEVANRGLWYDVGFYMAVISGFGGLNLVRSRGSKGS